MLFNTPQYILFLPAVVALYYILPKKIRYIWLLIASCYFYMQWNPAYIMLLLACTVVTYIGGRIIGSLADMESKRLVDDEKEDMRYGNKLKFQKKLCMAVCIILNLCILGFFKYFNFGIYCINFLLSHVHLSEINTEYNIILPVGISFYTLQALGYLIDVYRNDIQSEKNFLRYALFVSFFPQLVAGPIERSQNLLVQLREPHSFDYENIRKGALLVLYGLFLKMVIADRAAMIVDTVYENGDLYSGFYIAAATFFFAIQIYCDFYGYSTIARGSALLMGIKLMDNFNAPYFSRSVKEFWRRWHISLSFWFRDYLYIPLGGNRKGKARKEGNLITVFTVSGLWHGAALSFVFWGFLNGIYQVIGDVFIGLRRKTDKILTKLRIYSTDVSSESMKIEETERFSKNLFKTLFTFALISFAWIFFRAGSFRGAYVLIRNMLSVNNWTVLFDGSLYTLGVAANYMKVLIAAIIVLFFVDYLKYNGKDVAALFLSQGWWFRVACIMLMLFTILLYGCYGELYDTEQFIYFQF